MKINKIDENDTMGTSMMHMLNSFDRNISNDLICSLIPCYEAIAFAYCVAFSRFRFY